MLEEAKIRSFFEFMFLGELEEARKILAELGQQVSSVREFGFVLYCYLHLALDTLESTVRTTEILARFECTELEKGYKQERKFFADQVSRFSNLRYELFPDSALQIEAIRAMNTLSACLLFLRQVTVNKLCTQDLSEAIATWEETVSQLSQWNSNQVDLNQLTRLPNQIAKRLQKLSKDIQKRTEKTVKALKKLKPSTPFSQWGGTTDQYLRTTYHNYLFIPSKEHFVELNQILGNLSELVMPPQPS